MSTSTKNAQNLLIQTLIDEKRRNGADVTEDRLFKLLFMAMSSEDWQELSNFEQSNLVFEIRSLVVLKRNLESSIASMETEVAEQN